MEMIKVEGKKLKTVTSGISGDGSKQDIRPMTAQATTAFIMLKPIWRDYNKLVLFCETL